MSRKCRRFSGSSIGCVVSQTCSRRYSEGRRFRCGVSSHLKRLPSEYLREHVWLTTQPMEEPEKRRHFRDIVEWIGPDRLLFATDYPHWDFDDPNAALPARLDENVERGLMFENARALYT